MAVALFSLVWYAVWAQNDTTTVVPIDISAQSPMEDDIQSRLKALRARLELIKQRARKCGNDVVDPWEQCDDGNRLNGDGCSRTCTMGVVVNAEPPLEVASSQVALNIKVFLQWAYNASQWLMNDGLRAGGYLSFTGPVLAGQKAPVLPASRLQVVWSSAIVDWVIVDLRMLAIPTTSIDTIGVPISSIVKSVPALVLRNGQVVWVDGQSLKIQAEQGAYFVSVRHRNHLGVMTAQSEYLSSNATSLDFTNGTTVAYGNNAQKNLNGVHMMRAWDANGDNKVAYQGAGGDAEAVLTTVWVSTPNAIVEGYLTTDLNLDGKVKYNWSANDKNVVLGVVGLATQANVVQGQLP